jgi:hypothetical protein
MWKAIKKHKKQFRYQFMNRCPRCNAKLDNTVHGYKFKQNHCHNCHWCTQAERYHESECGAK